MIRSQQVFRVFEVLLAQFDGFVESARSLVGGSKVIAEMGSVWSIRAKDIGKHFEVLLVQGNGFVESAHSLIGIGEVVACDQGVGLAEAHGFKYLKNRISESEGELRHSKVDCVL